MTVKNNNLPPRAEAALLLAQVIATGKSLAEVFANLDRNTEQHALIQELCYGTLRWYFQLEAIAQQLLQKPFDKKNAELQALLLIGLYQILYLRVPDHAAVTETVNAARALGKSWSTKLFNAVLRRFLREREQIMQEINKNPLALYAHSQWLLTTLQQAWPDAWQSIIATNNSRPPMTLRVNSTKVHADEVTARDHYLQLLADAHIAAHAAAYADNGITLEQPCGVKQLPGFALGWVSVQDQGAQLAAPLLNVQAGQTVLDACAAPGGKTTHILELTPDLAELIAIDVDAMRLMRIEENLQRLSLNDTNKIKLRAGDVCQIAGELLPSSIDRMLLDVPCSATGVIRRHPDIKLLRRAEDIDQFVKQQRQILNTCWPLLKRGGRLLYITCSILPQENVEQIARFLVEHADAQAIAIMAEWGLPCKWGRQILPGMHNMDGFYYACLEKL